MFLKSILLAIWIRLFQVLTLNRSLKEDGYVYSDGTTVLGADDKAGIAALLEMIQTINEQQLPHGQIQFIITVGEEAGVLKN